MYNKYTNKRLRKKRNSKKSFRTKGLKTKRNKTRHRKKKEEFLELDQDHLGQYIMELKYLIIILMFYFLKEELLI